MKTWTLGLSFGPLLLSACVSLESVPVNQNSPIKGAVYYLPITNFKLDITHQLQQCTPEKLKIHNTVQLTTSAVPDYSHAYYIDYEKLQHWTKSLEFKIDYFPNGVVKSINTDITDTSGNLISGVVKIASNTALAAAVAIPLAEIQKCNQQTLDHLQTIKTYKSKRKALEEALKSVNDWKELHPNNNKIPIELTTKLKKAKEAESAFYKKYTTAQKHLTISYLKNFQGLTTSTSIQPNNHILKKWFDNPKTLSDDDKKTYTVYFRAISLQGISNKNIPTNSDGHADGLVYSLPATGQVDICQQDECWNQEKSDNVILTKKTTIAGAGGYAVLPYKNSFMVNNKLSAIFTNTGILASVTYTRASSSDTAINTLKDATQAYLDHQNKLQQQSITNLEVQKKSLSLQSDIDKLLSGPKPKTEIELQIEQLENEIRLRELNSQLGNMDIEDLRRERDRLQLLHEIEQL